MQCIQCVFILDRMRVESGVFYLTISQRSCHVQHSTCSQNTAGQSVFNIQEFLTAFTTLHCTVRQRILHRKCIALQRMRFETRVFYPTISHRSCHVQHSTLQPTLHVQYTRVSSCFFTIRMYYKQVYFTWEKWIQCAYGVFLHCRNCALKHGCFIRRY